MKNENFHDGFENLFREKLESIEYSYSSSDWSDLQKGLRKQGLSKGSVISTSVIVSVVVSSVVILSTAIYFLQNNNGSTIKNENIIVKNENNLKTSNIIIEPNNEQVKHESDYSAKPSQFSSQNCVKHSEAICKSINESKNCINEKVPNDNNNSTQKIVTSIEAIKNNLNIPDAGFTFDVAEGCSPLKVKFIPNTKCDSMIYLWSFGDGSKSTEVSPVHIFDQSGKYNAVLTTKFYKTSTVNTEMSDIAIIVKPSAVADFTSEIIKQDVTFRNMSSNFTQIEWNFGDSDNSILDVAEHKYKVDGTYNLKLIAYNNSGCNDTLLKKININIEHEYFVPTAFKPNGDSKNETFGPVGEGLDSYQYDMYIYNRFNNLIFETKDINIPWDGKIKGTNQMSEAGVYVWFIITKDKFGNVKKRKGNVTLLNK